MIGSVYVSMSEAQSNHPLPRPSRRAFIRHCGVAGFGAWASWRSLAEGSTKVPPVKGPRPAGRAKRRPDLLDADSPKGIEVLQLTTEPDVPSSHVYMEAPVFTPDSKRFVLHRSAHAHGSRQDDPQHCYLLCDLENDGALSPLTDEVGATGPSVSPDGQYLYYFVNATEVGGGRLTLKRVKLDGTHRETILAVAAPLPGTNLRPSQIYPLSTISSDGKRVAISAFLGDGRTEGAPFGLMVFDVEKATVALILQGPSWCNLHPQFCRSLAPDARRDIMIQENHGNVCNAKGEIQRLTGGEGADIHVVCDDGTNFRNLPWGRDGNEFCQGHQCWRGRSTWAITSTGTRNPPEAQLIEGRAAPPAGHLGIKTPGGVRNDLSRSFSSPHFYHFATDGAGHRLISDAGPLDKHARIFLATLGQPGQDPAQPFTHLLAPQSTCVKGAHIHPFLSPDGTLGFFNSDESGLLQAYLIRGLNTIGA